ncbi:MAG TPA: glycosyltransferase [Vicinamibacterales bacterium]|jgi:glycosyltransferase involved in cell wall biosynthesis|nr:glycosyltransferase [Vicinamibacterales bacterium]
MKILMVFHAPPYPPDIGPSRRHYHVLMETVARHDVTVLSLGSPVDRTALLDHTRLDPSRVHFVRGDRTPTRKALRAATCLATARSDFCRLRRKGVQRRLDRLMAAESFDVVYFSTVMLGCYRLPRGVPLVGDTHNVEHDNLARAASTAPEGWRRLYYRVQAALTKREERVHLRKFQIVCATSARDRDVLKRLAPEASVRIVPNGIDLQKYSLRGDTGTERGLILFTGLMSYYPNVHAVLRFAKDVFPLIARRVPAARFVVVGANPPATIRALASDRIEITGRVPDVRPYYARASVAVVPLSIGGGTRVKVLESMATGVPVVSTALGCEGLDVAHEHSVLLADSDQALADAVVRVLRSPVLASSLSSHGREVAVRYDWKRIAPVFDDIVHAAAARGAPTMQSTAGACRAY